MRFKKIISLATAFFIITNSGLSVMAADTSHQSKSSIDNSSRSSVIMDHARTYGSAPFRDGFYWLESWADSYSDVKNDVITTKNYLVMHGYQQDSKTNTEYNVTRCKTSKTSCGISSYDNAYTHSTHIFKLKGYKDHIMNTSRTL